MIPHPKAIIKERDREKSRANFILNSGQISPMHSQKVFGAVPMTSTSMGLDRSLILAPTGGYSKDVKRLKALAFAVDTEGKAFGEAQEVVIFSDQMKPRVTKNEKGPDYQDMHYQNHPWIPTSHAKYLQGQFTGFTPVSLLFHAMSKRLREGPDDYGLDTSSSSSGEEEEDPLTGDPNDEHHHVKDHEERMKRRHDKYNRRSLLYESINKIGMVKGDFAFPRRTYLPKTLIPYVVADNQVPKAIVVERLTRAYRAVDINLILQNTGVTPTDLIPPANYGEANERFYEEKMLRNRTKIEGVEKAEYISREGKIHLHLRRNQIFPVVKRKDTSVNIMGTQTRSYRSTSVKYYSQISESISSESEGSDDTVDGSAHNKHHFHRPPFDPQFPLHYFDDEDFDIRGGIEWLALGWDPEEKKNYAIPGKAYLPFPLPPHKKNLPTVATKTYKSLLAKSERLEELRKTLMKSRYRKMLHNVGIDPSLENISAQNLELAMMAKATNTASSSFMNIPSFVALPSMTARHSYFTWKSTRDDSLLDIHDEGSADSDDELFGKIQESVVGLQFDLLELKKEYEKPCYTQAAIQHDLMDKGTVSRMYLEKNGSDMDVDRSESLLSEIFSQESLAPSSIENETEAEKDDKTENDISESSSEMPDLPDNPHHGKKSVRIKTSEERLPGKQERLGLNEAPNSPDEDAFDSDEAVHDLIYDYNKMKKPYNYDWKWADVAVLDYDMLSHKFLVCSTTRKPKIFAWVGKSYLCFDGEDPYVHAERIKDSIIRRYETEHLMRYNLYIDNLPTDNAPIASEEVVKRIARKIRWSGKGKTSEKFLTRLSLETDVMYQRVHTKIRFEKLFEKMPHVFRPWVHKPVSDFKLGDYQHNPNVWESRKDRYFKNKRSFAYRVLQLQKKTFLTCKETRLALEEIFGICEEAKKMSFILMNLDEHVHLDEYERLQTDHVTKIIQYMKNEWFAAILSTIRTQLGKVDNAWFNLKEKDYQIYSMSRLPAFLTLVNYIMEECVRSMILESCFDYNEHIRKLTLGCYRLRKLDWGNDLTASKYPPPKGMAPLFILELKMDSDGPKYTQLLSKYLLTPTRIFSQCIKSVQRFPQLKSILLPNFRGNERGCLDILTEEDPIVIYLRLQSQSLLKTSLLLLDSYAQKFRRYMHMWTMDDHPHPYIESKGDLLMNVATLREELDRHEADIEKIEKEISSELVVSAFYVNADIVKQSLIKKKKTACHLMLTNFADKLKSAVLKIMNKYNACERKLGIRSDDIKEVMELKDYSLTVPSMIADSILKMFEIVKDYEIFDEYNFVLRDEDVENKWVCAAQSNRMVKMAARAMDMLEDDYDRLYRVQQQDLSSLSDQLDSAGLSIAALNCHSDLEKAHDVANEVRKVWHMVRDLETQISILNERQVIFKQPITQSESLSKLLYDIEPYKNLWFTAVECLKVRDSLLKDTLEKIDVTSLTKSVLEGHKVIDHCIAYFHSIMPPIEQVALEVKHLIETDTPILPLVDTFKSHAMKSRHWDEVSAICGFPVYSKASEPFKKLLDKGILKNADEIIRIGRTALNETEILTSVDRMEHYIEEFSIRVQVEPTTGVSIIMLPQTALDTVLHCLKDTDKLVESPYKSMYEEMLTNWWNKIHGLKNNLELWFHLQDEWLDIQPLLPIIKTQTRTPNVLSTYKRASRVWRRLIRLANEAQLMGEAARSPAVTAALRQLQVLLEKIRQGMEEYANRKTGISDSDDD